jgi:uncharacterized protein YqgV (UPF0045/DUF77 family)
MWMELNVVPTGKGAPPGPDVDEILKVIDKSGLDYRLSATGINIEGAWEQLVDVARLCHHEMRKKADHVITTIKIDDSGESAARPAAMIKPVESTPARPSKK